jgi:hypothetical protein
MVAIIMLQLVIPGLVEMEQVIATILQHVTMAIQGQLLLNIFDGAGKSIKYIRLNNDIPVNEYIFEGGNMTPGLYFYIISDGNFRLFTGNFMIAGQ